MKYLFLKILIASMAISSAASALAVELECGTDTGQNVDIQLWQSPDWYFNDCWRIELTCTSGIPLATASFVTSVRSFNWLFEFAARGEPYPYNQGCHYSGTGGVSDTATVEVTCRFVESGKANFRAHKVPNEVCN